MTQSDRSYSPQPSSERLAQVLDEAHLPALARRARQDEFHDFKSPHVMPEHELVKELRKIGGWVVREIAERVIAGEFGATKAESDEWAASPEGQAIYAELLKGIKR
jgi:hypothetical protein